MVGFTAKYDGSYLQCKWDKVLPKVSHTEYRGWTSELEETLKEIQRQMEDACEDYFKQIQPNAIKVGVQAWRLASLAPLLCPMSM